MERLASAEAARRFGYTPAAFRMLCYDFRGGRLPDFFASTRPGPREQPKKSRAREQVVALRKRNYSIYDISKALKQQGTPLGATAVREILAEEGFAPLPRRLDEERAASVGPTTEAVADVRSFTLAPREFTTRVGEPGGRRSPLGSGRRRQDVWHGAREDHGEGLECQVPEIFC